MTPESVLLVEPGEAALRLVTVATGTTYIVERPTGFPIREWRWMAEERASGFRVFREILPPPIPEPAECPIYDELQVKL